jgi:ribosomal protein S18 acetylase RimI-like enzyme
MTTYRPAAHEDETDILAVLEEVASEIPVRLDGDERQRKIQTEIIQCRQAGKSWVAVDTHGKVVGFVLARPHGHEGKAAIYIPYVGVSAASRRRGIFSTLIGKLKANGVQLIANVLRDNHSNMEDILVKEGFTKIDCDAKQKKFLWSPAAN